MADKKADFLNLINDIKDVLHYYDTTYIRLFQRYSYQLYIFNMEDDYAEGVVFVFTNNEDEVEKLTYYEVNELNPLIPRLILIGKRDEIIINDTSDESRVVSIGVENIDQMIQEDIIYLLNNLTPDTIKQFFDQYAGSFWGNIY